MKKIKNKNGISLTCLVITIIVLLIIASISVLLLNGAFKAFEIEKNNLDIQQSCEHEWVITSEYSFLFNSYRTVSKCSKCGKVIK